MQRPAGITVLAIVDFLGGFTSFVISCFAMVTSWWLIAEAEDSDAVSPAVATNLAFRGNLVFWIGLLGMGASLFNVVAAAGLWTRQPWGRQLVLISSTVKLASHLVAAMRRKLSPAGVVGLFVDSAVIFYLTRPYVRQALSGAPVDAESTTSWPPDPVAEPGGSA
jgi:uncharacterized membrane protein (DUF2068 family)